MKITKFEKVILSIHERRDPGLAETREIFDTCLQARPDDEFGRPLLNSSEYDEWLRQHIYDPNLSGAIGEDARDRLQTAIKHDTFVNKTLEFYDEAVADSPSRPEELALNFSDHPGSAAVFLFAYTAILSQDPVIKEHNYDPSIAAKARIEGAAKQRSAGSVALQRELLGRFNQVFEFDTDEARKLAVAYLSRRESE